MKSNFYYSGGNKPVPYSTAPSKYRKRYKDSVRGSGNITADVTGETILGSTPIVSDFTPNWIRILFAISLVIIFSGLVFQPSAEIQNPLDTLKTIIGYISDFGVTVRSAFANIRSSMFSSVSFQENGTLASAFNLLFVQPIGLFIFILTIVFSLFALLFQILGILGGALV